MTEKEGAIDANLTFYKQLSQILEQGLKILIQVAKEISQNGSVLVTLAEDMCLVPRIHICRPTTTYNTSFRGF